MSKGNFPESSESTNLSRGNLSREIGRISVTRPTGAARYIYIYIYICMYVFVYIYIYIYIRQEQPAEEYVMPDTLELKVLPAPSIQVLYYRI